MTLKEIKQKVLTLIEESDESDTSKTNDPDIEAKLPYVINQIQYELSRIKKIPKYKEIEVEKDDTIEFTDIDSEIYQIDVARGVEYEYKANNTIIKIKEDGKLEVEYFKYPERIDADTEDDYEFELSDDVIEILPYGVAADLLKSDVSNAYGNVYANRYAEMKNQLDMRYNTGSIEYSGGIEI